MPCSRLCVNRILTPLDSQMSQYPHGPGHASDDPALNSSIFSATSEPHLKKLSVSNLTRNLMSSCSSYNQERSPGSTAPSDLHFNRQSPSYTPSSSSAANYTPSAQFGLHHEAHSNSSSFSRNQSSYFTSSNMGAMFTPPNGNLNHIPLGHNTPTVVSSSYTSNNSFTPSYLSIPTLKNDFAFNQQSQAPPSVIGGPFKVPGVPTTNINMDQANSHSSHQIPASYNRHSILAANSAFYRTQLENPAQSLPSSFAESTSVASQPTLQRLPSNKSVTQERPNTSVGVPNLGSLPQGLGGFTSEPDHYMSYKEYLALLNKRDENMRAEDENGYEDHLNIVEYPVDELITMLACLLTKIIDANDKLHPNHFDNTIAVRQKMKEQKRLRKSEKHGDHRVPQESTSYTSGDVNTTVCQIHEDDNSDDSSDDEKDELKNRYLANVLAFHGTNVPGITLHAYLTRVLKYCPVTNEVFLSLLVYFDRIAKRANNLQKKKGDGSDEGLEESEQLFVMDSYNIHRLIILGITVSSKFFSDIFYKNLRYAKVGGLPLEELNYLELQFLLLLDFKLMISVEDLQNYGDLLLKFWKREQLATEIVQREGEYASDTPQKAVS